MKKLRFCLLKIHADRFLDFGQTSALRGFIASRCSEDLLANRQGDKLRYQAALIQYKIINGNALVVGFEQGAEILAAIQDGLDSLWMQGERIAIKENAVLQGNQCIGISRNPIGYRFITPWLALSQKNFVRYCEDSQQEDVRQLTPDRIALLQRILIGNIICMSKHFSYEVAERIVVDDLALQTDYSWLKGVKMLSFTGTFRINFVLPEYWGIGHSPSRGFGTVTQI